MLVVFNISVFYAVILPSIADINNKGREAIAGVVVIVYIILLVLVVKYANETTKIDPTDETVYIEREAQIKGYDVASFDVNLYEYYCNVCKTHVLEHTKHC